MKKPPSLRISVLDGWKGLCQTLSDLSQMGARTEGGASPQDGDVEIVASSDVRGFYVVAEEDEGDQEVVNV